MEFPDAEKRAIQLLRELQAEAESHRSDAMREFERIDAVARAGGPGWEHHQAAKRRVLDRMDALRAPLLVEIDRITQALVRVEALRPPATVYLKDGRIITREAMS